MFNLQSYLLVCCLLGFTAEFAAGSSHSGFRIPLEIGRSTTEVTSAVTEDGVELIAWAQNVEGPLKSCAYSVTKDGGSSWSTPLLRKVDGFRTSLNQAVAADSLGRLYAVCMSADGWSDLRGRLDIAMSDDQGASWSPWFTVVEDEGMLPDKPWIAVSSTGSLILTYSAFRKSEGERLMSTATFVVSEDRGITLHPPQSFHSRIAPESDY